MSQHPAAMVLKAAPAKAISFKAGDEIVHLRAEEEIELQGSVAEILELREQLWKAISSGSVIVKRLRFGAT